MNSQREAGCITQFSSRKATVKSVVDEVVERHRLDSSLTNTLIHRLQSFLDRQKSKGKGWTLTTEEEKEKFHEAVCIVSEQEVVAEQEAEAVIESPKTPATPRGRPPTTNFALCCKKTKYNHITEQA